MIKAQYSAVIEIRNPQPPGSVHRQAIDTREFVTIGPTTVAREITLAQYNFGIGAITQLGERGKAQHAVVECIGHKDLGAGWIYGDIARKVHPTLRAHGERAGEVGLAQHTPRGRTVAER